MHVWRHLRCSCQLAGLLWLLSCAGQTDNQTDSTERSPRPSAPPIKTDLDDPGQGQSKGARVNIRTENVTSQTKHGNQTNNSHARPQKEMGPSDDTMPIVLNTTVKPLERLRRRRRQRNLDDDAAASSDRRRRRRQRSDSVPGGHKVRHPDTPPEPNQVDQYSVPRAPSAVQVTTTLQPVTASEDRSSEFVKTIPMEGLNLWIDAQEIEQFVGVPMDIFVIREGSVVPYLQEAYLDLQLPVLPPEVHVVRLTWQAKDDLYQYHFTDLRSLDPKTLYDPLLSVTRQGYVPRDRTDFQMTIPCTGHGTAIASMYVSLEVLTSRGRPIHGGPIRLHLRKRCLALDSRRVCAGTCANGGSCGENGRCQCRPGFYGDRCQMAMCFPECENNGTCVAPHQCRCKPGYVGDTCHNAVCEHDCLNGGFCAHPDICECSSGFYGKYCQLRTGLCDIPCKNGGTCTEENQCSCREGYTGVFCQTPSCERSCGVHGRCADVDVCLCNRGWRGKYCHKTIHRLKEKDDRRIRRKEKRLRHSRGTDNGDGVESSKPRRRRRRKGRRKNKNKGKRSSTRKPRLDV